MFGGCPGVCHGCIQRRESVVSFQIVAIRHEGVGQPVVWVLLYRLAKVIDCVCKLLLGSFVIQIKAHQVGIVSSRITSETLIRLLFFVLRQFQRKSLGKLVCD